ncbi:MAG: hypothetical protein OEO21_12780 [Candidatus Krumholzibacteria bacterium]|nr:hypothetical protein [Candidatus Krumholzibacteria bacterium]
MIGDKVNTQPKHVKAAGEIYALVAPSLGQRMAFTVAGQSGAGKSEIAVELARLFEEAGLKTYIFQQDDYFHYPPRTNHHRRVDDIAWVGPQEVDLKRLDAHLDAFKHAPARNLEKPLVVFGEDRIITEQVDLSPFSVVIAEGTYTTLLVSADYRVFIDRDYFDTREDRKDRGREVVDEFSERVLKIEDAIISKHRDRADILVDKNFSVRMAERPDRSEE